MKKNVAILVFKDAEVLDFAGPFEVFSVASQITDEQLFNVFTVSKEKGLVKSINGLAVNAEHSFRSAPVIDILIVAGGTGTRNLIEDKAYLNWIRKVHQQAEMTLSICSAARIMGRLGLLDGVKYVTHHEVYDHVMEIAPKGIPVKGRRFIKGGKLYSSGGISAGIDLSFHIVEKLHGKKIARKTAAYMEYQRNGSAKGLS